MVRDEDGTWSVGKKYGLSKQGAANYLNELGAEKAKGLFGSDVTAQRIATGQGGTPKKPWEGKDVETVLGGTHGKMNPMWFDGQDAESKPFMKLRVKENADGTYDAYLQDKNHSQLKSHVSSNKDAEDTMNNIWRAGVLPHPNGEEMRRIIVDGINHEKKAKQLQWAEPAKAKAKDSELPGMKDTYLPPGLFRATKG